jgi:hypothetical protein
MEKLRIVSTQCAPVVDNQPAEHAKRPLCELLQDYGPLLLIEDDRVLATTPDSMFAADSLYVSLLNVDTLLIDGDHSGDVRDMAWPHAPRSISGWQPAISRLRLTTGDDDRRSRTLSLYEFLQK